MTYTFPRHSVLVFALLIASQPFVYGQEKKLREYKRIFQFSLFPGISTNGIASGSYYNKYSLNLLGGFSAGNGVLEVGLISNGNIKSTTGIQISGLANIIGPNAFVNLTLSEERALIHDGFEANMKGIQLAGFLNYVLNNSNGIQFSGGLNVVGDDFNGVQFAGLGNSAGGTTVGLQLAGFYNISQESVGGFQISSFFNYTDEQLSGLQIAMINKSRGVTGKKSTPPSSARGLQVGIFNFSRAMHGTQIGLINFGGEFRGKQFGLINFFNRIGTKEMVRMGTPVGLLNFGSRGSYLRIYYSELFAGTIEYSTGNCLNCSHVQSEMPFKDGNKIYNQNALILGFDPLLDTWGFGYGFQKILYNKVSMMPIPANEKRMISYGIKFLHLNREMKFDKTFNVVTRLNADYGKRFRSIYWFVGLSLNYFVHDTNEDEDVYNVNSLKISSGKIFEMNSDFWLGYSIGAQL